MLESHLRTLDEYIQMFDQNIKSYPYEYIYMIQIHMLDPLQIFQVVPRMINFDQTNSGILVCFTRWVSSIQRVFFRFFRTVKPAVLRAMWIIIFWKISIVKTTSKKMESWLILWIFFRLKLQFLFMLQNYPFCLFWAYDAFSKNE